MAASMGTNTSEVKKRDYRDIPPVPRSVWTNPLHFVAFGFGFGAIPFAPGTFGTLIAIPFYLAMQNLTPISYFAMLVLVSVASMWICHKASLDIQVEDHQGMCLDEIVGFLVTMFLAPHGWKWIWIGFGLFRLFDIWKPWPIYLVDEKVKGGVGVILDDILAGILAMVVLQILKFIFV